MAENNQLPKFKSLDELTDFFDQNDMGDYSEQMPEADFEVNLKRRSFFVAVDEEILSKLAEIAKLEHQPSDSIVNSWLREKISGYSEKI
jgi:hypothetical protein